MLNAVPERARSSVLKALKDISANLGAPSRANLGVISGLPRSVQDDLEQCCGAGTPHRVVDTPESALTVRRVPCCQEQARSIVP
jgi:hypothetical protein